MTSNLYISAGIEGKGISAQMALAKGPKGSVITDIFKGEICVKLDSDEKKAVPIMALPFTVILTLFVLCYLNRCLPNSARPKIPDPNRSMVAGSGTE